MRCRPRHAVSGVLAMVATVTLAMPSFAQDETLIKGPIDSTSFGGPVIKLTEVDGAARMILGVRGTQIYTRSFVVALAPTGSSPRSVEQACRTVGSAWAMAASKPSISPRQRNSFTSRRDS